MTHLNSRNQNTAQQISDLSNQIELLKQQLEDLTQAVRTTQQIHKAQETLTKEWQNVTLKTMGKHLKDACSVYGDVSVIDDMLNDIQDIANEIKENFDEYQQSDRYLNQVTAEEQDYSEEEKPQPDYQDYNLLVSADDDLTTAIAKEIIADLDKPILDKIKEMLSIHSRTTKIDSIARAIASKKIKRDKLLDIIELAKSQQLLLSGLSSNEQNHQGNRK